jgi:hypothetical protein
LPSPYIAASLVLAALLSAACANRGMHRSPRDGGGGAAGGGSGGRGGAGGTTGLDGGGADAMEAGCPLPPPPDGVDAGPCTAKFNFEMDMQEAHLAVNGQAAFTAVAASGAQTFCGSGALAITASFSGGSGTTTKGVVEIPVDQADADFTGKTITVHFMAVPGCSTDLGVAISLQTDVGDRIVLPTFRPVTSTWKTESVTLSADAGVAGQDTVRNISVQAFSFTGYQGTIYVDEIEVTGP